jgi:hypothetical protein
MPGPKPILGYPSRTACCLALREQGKSNAEISSLTGIGGKVVSRLVVRRPMRRPRSAEPHGRIVLFLAEVLDELKPHAARRGITANELARRIVEIAAGENMIDAILDDGHEVQEP